MRECTHIHTWMHVPSLWFEFTCARAGSQHADGPTCKLGALPQTRVHRRSPSFIHVAPFPSLSLVQTHVGSLTWKFQFSSVEFNSIPFSPANVYWAPTICHRLYLAMGILKFFKKRWDLRSQFRGGGQPWEQRRQVRVPRAVADVHTHTNGHM